MRLGQRIAAGVLAPRGEGGFGCFGKRCTELPDEQMRRMMSDRLGQRISRFQWDQCDLLGRPVVPDMIRPHLWLRLRSNRNS